MVARSSNSERLHLILFCDSAKIWPEPFSQIRAREASDLSCSKRNGRDNS